MVCSGLSVAGGIGGEGVVASGTSQGALLMALALTSPVQALSTAVTALLILAAFREWFALRLDL
jgi:hypothetical protein